MAEWKRIAGASAGTGGWLLAFLALWILFRCLHSLLLRERCPPEVWGILERAEDSFPLEHWECLIGAGPDCDITADGAGVAEKHAVLRRSDRGEWTLWDLSGGITVHGTDEDGENLTLEDEGEGIPLEDGDRLCIGDWSAAFRSVGKAPRGEAGRWSIDNAGQWHTLALLTLFQLLLAVKCLLRAEPERVGDVALGFSVLVLAQWTLYLLVRAVRRRSFDVETLGFFLCTLGMAVCASAAPGEIRKQLLALGIGLSFFLFLCWWLRNQARTFALRQTVGVLALVLLAVNLAMGVNSYGATNWLLIHGISIQPSEFVKLAYVYVGAISLDKLHTHSPLFDFALFSLGCILALALMGDFGAALIFFAGFLLAAFLRTGSCSVLAVSLSGAGLAGLLARFLRPHIASRLSAWGNIWNDPFNTGWQQTHALAAAARGGLTGVGAGKGWLRNIFAGDTDLVFCMVCEELGLVIASCAVLAVVGLALFAVRMAARGRSSWHVMAANIAAAMLSVQLALNVFGSTDLLPFTGVTFPFVSRGGSSLISCWGMLAFLKAADTRPASSFAVPLFRRRDRRYGIWKPKAAEEPTAEAKANHTGKNKGKKTGEAMAD